MTRFLQGAVFVAALLCLLAPDNGRADVYGYAINSRGNFQDDALVFALWRINLATGQETYVGWTGAGIVYTDVEGLAFNDAGQLFGADDDTNTLLRINTTNGVGTPVGGSDQNMGLPSSQIMDFGMTFDCEGRLWLSSSARNELYSGNPETGSLSQVGSAGSLGVPITGLAAWGEQVYGIGRGSRRKSPNGPDLPDSPNLYTIDVASGTAQLVGPLGGAVALYHNAGLAFDGEGGLWAITDRRDINGQDLPSQVLSINPETGSAAVVSETIVGIESLAIDQPGGCEPPEEEPEPDPEPDPDPEPGRGAGDIQEIPTLGWPGLLIFGLLILFVAAPRLIRSVGD